MYFIIKTRDFYLHSGILILLLFTCDLRAQEDSNFNSILDKLASYTALSPPDKVYLHTDKDFYSNGETIWFKTYVVDGVMHLESKKSKVVYVELLDTKDSIIAQRKIYTAPDWAAGDIALPENIEEGTYLLRAYTKYMLNEDEPVFFQKEIPVWQKQVNANDVSNNEPKDENPNEATTNQGLPDNSLKPLVQFFPEGGHLVSGLKNVLGLKITDAKGNGITLRGDIVDGNGTKIVPFRSFEFGLASAYFDVEPDTEYFAQIEINGVLEKYTLPNALSKGYTLQLTNHGEHIVIRIATNIHNGLEGTFLLGHLRGSLIFNDFMENTRDSIYEIKLSTAKLDDGVAHFTLFAPNGEPLCERLTFIENPKNRIALSVKTDRAYYGFREQVGVRLALQDENGKPMDGRFSMSVASENSLKKKTSTLKSWLLLNSDL